MPLESFGGFLQINAENKLFKHHIELIISFYGQIMRMTFGPITLMDGRRIKTLFSWDLSSFCLTCTAPKDWVSVMTATVENWMSSLCNCAINIPQIITTHGKPMELVTSYKYLGFKAILTNWSVNREWSSNFSGAKIMTKGLIDIR